MQSAAPQQQPRLVQKRPQVLLPASCLAPVRIPASTRRQVRLFHGISRVTRNLCASRGVDSIPACYRVLAAEQRLFEEAQAAAAHRQRALTRHQRARAATALQRAWRAGAAKRTTRAAAAIRIQRAWRAATPLPMRFMHTQVSAVGNAVQKHEFAFNTQRMPLPRMQERATSSSGGLPLERLEPSMVSLACTPRGQLLMQELRTAILQGPQLPVKAKLEGVGLYARLGADGQPVPDTLPVLSHMHSSYQVLSNPGAVNAVLVTAAQAIDNQVGARRDSMRFLGFLGMRLHLAVYRPVGGRSYFPLGKTLDSKHATINIQNKKDDKCFLYSLVCGILRLDSPHLLGGHPERVSTYKNYMNLVTVPEGASVPPAFEDYPAFEAANHLSLNVYRVDLAEPEDVQPYYTTAVPPPRAAAGKAQQRHVDLLLVSESGSEEGQGEGQVREHYVVITNKSRLLSSSISKNAHKMHFCDRCHQHFASPEALASHEQLKCWETRSGPASAPVCKAVMPEAGSQCMFSHPDRCVRAPFVVYADFEAANVPLGAEAGNGTCLSSARTIKLTQHQATSYAFCFLADGQPPRLFKHSDPDPAALVSHFMTALMDCAREAQETLLTTNLPLCLTAEQQASHDSAATCYACRRPFEDDSQEVCKVADHDHLTGEYRGAAHCSCNLRMRDDRFSLPVLFHNLKGYDAHHLLANISDYAVQNGLQLGAIPLNTEKLISLSCSQPFTASNGKKGKLRVQFLDSFQFLGSSLDTLASNLKGGQSDEGLGKFRLLQHFVGQLLPSQQQAIAEPTGPNCAALGLLTRKGVFPYDWFDCYDKLTHTQLPPQTAFFSTLSQRGVSDADYQHAQNVWQAFGCRNFQDYLDLYIQTDVLLLADVFEAFRATCHAHFHLDPCRYFTLPGLGFDAMLRMTGAQLELLSEEDMHLFVEKGIRGGVAMISHRAASANNPYMGAAYDPSQPTSHILYLDANSLYPWAMQQALPTGGFKWEKPDELGGMEGVLQLLRQTPDDGPIGYFLEVDLHYPSDLHDEHSDLPFAPERLTVTEQMLSAYNEELLAKFEGAKYVPEEKLVPNLCDKSGYVVHFAALKQMLAHGLQLKAVHRCLRFEQSHWMKPYVDFCVTQRQAATSDFERDLFKLLMNSVFGKTMENVRKRTDLRIFASAGRRWLVRKLASPFVRSVTVLSPHLVIVESHKTRVQLNKPIYTGAAVLDLSKTLVLGFHYDVMQARYGHERCKLLFTDTDSLCYHVQTEDIYKDLHDIREHLDLSGYPASHFLHDPLNAKVAGKFKDETHGRPIIDYIGLKPKLYAYRTLPLPDVLQVGECSQSAVSAVTCKRHKGVPRAAMEGVGMKEYGMVLQQGARLRVDTHSIRSHKHTLHTIRQHKVALSAFDTKRLVCEDGIHTLAYGHYRGMAGQ